MNSTSKQSTSSPTPADLAFPLAELIRRRREQLGLSIERAAELSGIEPSQWQALEAGWVPTLESRQLEAIAETLEYGFIQILFIAEISRYKQEVLLNSLLRWAN